MKNISSTNFRLLNSIFSICIFISIGFAQNTLSVEVGDGTIDVLYNSDVDIGGFQFNVEGATVTGASGGDAGAAGFTVSNNQITVLAFSLTGGTIPAGSGTLLVIDAVIDGDDDGVGVSLA